VLWPYFATVDDCKGLPPTVISANELCPVRDEGMQHYQKLMKAGVRARCRVVAGTVHAADMWFEQAIPDVYASTISDIKHFVDSL
jgi:acetyl esterase/lipase